MTRLPMSAKFEDGFGKKRPVKKKEPRKLYFPLALLCHLSASEEPSESMSIKVLFLVEKRKKNKKTFIFRSQ